MQVTLNQRPTATETEVYNSKYLCPNQTTTSERQRAKEII